MGPARATNTRWAWLSPSPMPPTAVLWGNVCARFTLYSFVYPCAKTYFQISWRPYSICSPVEDGGGAKRAEMLNE